MEEKSEIKKISFNSNQTYYVFGIKWDSFALLRVFGMFSFKFYNFCIPPNLTDKTLEDGVNKDEWLVIYKDLPK